MNTSYGLILIILIILGAAIYTTFDDMRKVNEYHTRVTESYNHAQEDVLSHIN